MCQRVALAQIFAVARGVLRDEHQLLDALLCQLLGLVHHGAEAAAAEVAAHLRDEAEGARAVAPFGDLDESGVAGRRQNTRRGLVVKVRRALVAVRDLKDWERARVLPLVADFRYLADLIRAD